MTGHHDRIGAADDAASTVVEHLASVGAIAASPGWSAPAARGCSHCFATN